MDIFPVTVVAMDIIGRHSTDLAGIRHFLRRESSQQAAVLEDHARA